MGLSPSLHVQEPSLPGKPWVILIHGLGMTHRSWIDPFAETLLGGLIPFDYVLTDIDPLSSPVKLFNSKRLGCSPPLRVSQTLPQSFWEVLSKEGYGIITWSQGSPWGKVVHAIEELQIILEDLPRRDKIVLLGHSRGGIIARKYLQDERPECERISGIALLGAPNHGSQIAKLTQIFSRIHLSGLFGAGKGRRSGTREEKDQPLLLRLIRILGDYSHQAAIRELAPRSDFMKELVFKESEEIARKVAYLNLIGTRSDFIRLYRLGPTPSSKPKLLFSLLGSLEKMIPHRLILPEIKPGRGDGQVSVESATLPWAKFNHLLPVNHAQFLVNSGVNNMVNSFINNI
jgi:pimeloyl-ACP methyl ester carboxylesterase